MWHMRTYRLVIIVLIVTKATALAASTFGAPINVVDESVYDLRNPYHNTGSDLSNAFSGLYSGLTTNTYQSSYPILHSSYNNLQQNPFTQNVGNFNPISNFGGSFYSDGVHIFNRNLAELDVQSQFHNGNGLGSHDISLSSGYPFDTAYTGYGNNIVGFTGYSDSNFDSGLSYGSQKYFK